MNTARSIDTPGEAFEPRTFGRYVLYAPIARGGMATIHVARLVGDDGFSRIVAAKRLHPQFTEDPEFVAMFRDEAEIASKIHHPNVVPVLDIVLAGEEVVLVQEYVHGVPLDRLFRAARLAAEPIPPRIVVGIMAGVLAGLHSAHETCDERGEPLGIVHRDVSPQNVMVSVDGIPRLLDFGIAKASSSAHVTRAGLLKGKIAYMAPEQIRGDDVTPAADIYATGVVLWELLTLERLHAGRGEAQILTAVLAGDLPVLTETLAPSRASMSHERWELLVRVERVVAKAIARSPQDRYSSAAEMLADLVHVAPAASALEVAEWVKGRCGEYLERRQQLLASNEDSWRSLSRIAAANATGVGPRSGVTRVRSEAAPLAPDDPELSLHATSHRYLSADLVPQTRRARVLPWAVAGVSLLVTAALLGALGAHHDAPVQAPAAPAIAPPEALVPGTVPAPEPSPSIEPTPAGSSFLALPPAIVAAPHPVRAFAPSGAAPRRTPASESAPGPHVVASPSPAPASVTTAPVSPKTDCEPPFYFEGTKKIFKPNCI